LFVAILLAGCAIFPRSETPEVGAPAWAIAPAVWRIRQVVLIEFGEAKIPIQGYLELNAATRTVRLIAMDDFGVTLFRLTITTAGETVDFMLPLVPHGEEVARSVATSLRRIYLAPGVAVAGAGESRLEADREGHVAAAGPRSGGRWRIWYDDYRDEGGVPVPHVIRYRERGGVSLAIRQESVKRVDR